MHEGTDEEYREKVLRKSDLEKMIAVEAMMKTRMKNLKLQAGTK
ncbi:hypothetical protein [Ligilactobacillus ruminis]|uniref:Uncharacterized protein n=1 Tax=Ligilactobacillus ruminis (strain ATCC 27782 / RF3) TaxID=1069534 RepID=G2SMD4_LIGR2|nr:hypothetical protein [Ligilactobacillus ruminis]AEN79047.1 Hypothetical protein LRC_18190 [Ligilactobacillus ruminis ATCC 27782]